MAPQTLPKRHSTGKPSFEALPAVPASAQPPTKLLQLGLDNHIHEIVVCAQDGNQPPKASTKMTKAQLLLLVRRACAAGTRVVAVQESCGFGFVLHRELVAAGAESIVITPMRLDQSRQRKTDRLDARALCLRLSRYLHGDRDQFRPIRIPSPLEQQRRTVSRRREFLGNQLRRLERRRRGGADIDCEAARRALPPRGGGKVKIMAAP